MSNVEPYQFEPEIKTKKSDENEETDDEGWETIEKWDVEESDDRETGGIDAVGDDEKVEEMLRVMNRLDSDESLWCKCSNCVTMCVNRECLCCQEVDEIKYNNLPEGVACITNHESFNPVCLNKDVLWTALVGLNDRECAWLPPRNDIPNRSYRYAAYRQFSWFIYTKLGRHVRRIIPSCVISKIHATFPEPGGNYTKFDGEDEGADGISEIEEAWEYLEI